MILPPLLGRLSAACVFALLLVGGGTGCTFFRNYGTGARIDSAQERPARREGPTRRMIVVITTDPAGAVANITFQRSSGSESLDAYVAQSIRENWPPQPSTRSVVELEYKKGRDKSFSDPKVLSSGPA